MSDPHVFGLEPDDLDGVTIEELSDYLDRGRDPVDPRIENSPACQIALGALERVRALAAGLLNADAAEARPAPDTWLAEVLENITLESRAGRRFPFPTGRADVAAWTTEGALRGLVRLVGDRVPGLLVRRIRFEGGPTDGTPMSVRVEASIREGEPLPQAVSRFRRALLLLAPDHFPFPLDTVDVVIVDLEAPPETEVGT